MRIAWILQEVDDLLDAGAVFDLLGERRTDAQKLPEEAAAHLQRAADHDVVESAHALEQRDVLEGARDAADGGFMRAHLGASLALEGDAAFLRLIEAVDDVEHRGLAGAVRPDDGADLALADVEGNVAHRLHAAERQRDVLHRQQHIVDRDVGSARGSHAAFPIGVATGTVAMSRIFTRALITPLRPSSNVTSVEISASCEPSYSALIRVA